MVTRARWGSRLTEISNGFAAHLGSLHRRPTAHHPAAFEAFMAHAEDVMQTSGVFGAGQAGARAAFDDLRAIPFTPL